MDRESQGKLKEEILSELGILEDDIHITRDEETMTFYIPIEKMDRAEDLLGDLEIISGYDYEHLVKLDIGTTSQ